MSAQEATHLGEAVEGYGATRVVEQGDTTSKVVKPSANIETADVPPQAAESGDFPVEDPEQPPPTGLPAQVHTSEASSLHADTTSEQDNVIDDADSAIGSFRSSRTTSVTSSVVEGVMENGRRYHSYREGSYHIPNDESEQDRLDLQHHVFLIANDGRLFNAPIPKEDIYDVLDVGCGTGKWCIDLADELPNAQVLGFDLSPIQPDMVPPNCQFLVDDLNSPWLFTQKFDLIHTRAMTPGVKDWPLYIRQAYEQLKPGGYIELHEANMPAGYTKDSLDPEVPWFVQWSEHFLKAGAKAGMDLAAPEKLAGWLQDAGFTDITLRWQHWPVGPWAKGAKNKEIGRWWMEDLHDGVRNTSAMFTRLLGWPIEEFEVFIAEVTKEIREQKRHTWAEICFAYARKPLAE